LSSYPLQDAGNDQQPLQSNISTETDSRITVSGQQQNILTGPRGGKFYVNANSGIKTYLKQKQPTIQTLPSGPPTLSQAAAGAKGAVASSSTVSAAAEEEAEAGADSTTGAALTADAAAVPAAAEDQQAAEGGVLADPHPPQAAMKRMKMSYLMARCT
jgi:hypothetical protein